MASAPEEFYAEEAIEEVILSETQTYHQDDSIASSSKKTGVQTYTVETDDQSSETDRLLSPNDHVRKRQAYLRAGNSYQRAIDEPWNGAYRDESRPAWRKPSVFWLLPGFIPFCIAFAGTFVPRSYLILDLICKDYLSDRASKDPSFRYMPILIGEDNNQCRVPEVQSLVSYFNTYQDTIAGILSAIVSPYLGALSDRIGRKKVLVISSCGGFVGEIITILVGRNPGSISVYWLLLGSVFEGLAGSFTVALALSFAYSSDCTPPAKRNVAFGYFYGALYTGFAVGPLLSGFLIKATGNIMIPFYVALGCHIYFISFITFIVPESLSKERQAIAREKHAKSVEETSNQSWTETIKQYNLLRPLGILWPTGNGSSKALRSNLAILALINMLMFGIFLGAMRIITIYAQYRYGWTAVESSFLSSASSAVRVLGLFVGLPLLLRAFRPQNQPTGHHGADKLDLSIIRITVFLDLLGYLGYAFAPSGAFMFAAGIIAALGGVGSPTLSSALTKHVPPDKTGQVLGASALLQAVSRVAFPIIFNLIYAKTVKIFAGIVFLCLSFVFIVIFTLSWFLKPNLYLHDETTVVEEPEVHENERAP